FMARITRRLMAPAFAIISTSSISPKRNPRPDAGPAGFLQLGQWRWLLGARSYPHVRKRDRPKNSVSRETAPSGRPAEAGRLSTEGNRRTGLEAKVSQARTNRQHCLGLAPETSERVSGLTGKRRRKSGYPFGCFWCQAQ